VKIDRTITAKGWKWGSDDFKVEVREENGNLVVQERQKGSEVAAIGYYTEVYRIDIEIPEGVSLKVRGDDGDYYIKNVNGAISLRMDDADAELAGCKGDRFEFRLDDGDIRMDQGRGSLEIDGDDADIEIYKASFTSIRANVDDGDLIIETSLANNGNYNIESQDGLIALNITGGGGEFEIRHDDGRVLTEGGFKTLEKDEHETRLALANGSAKVNLKADDARVKLRAQ
jgi:Putative adhesin